MKRELVDDLTLSGVSGLLVVLIKIGWGSRAVLYNSVVDKRSSGCHGFFNGEDCRKNLVVNLDL